MSEHPLLDPDGRSTGRDHRILSGHLGGARNSIRPTWAVTSPPAGGGRFREWPLTPRETEVLAAMAEGKTNAAIASVMVVSRKAVEKHVNSIFSKLLLNARDEQHPRVAAVLLYLNRVQAVARSEMPAPPRPVSLHHGRRHGLPEHRHFRP